MNETLFSTPVQETPRTRTTDWVSVGVFALVWIELISRLRFEWSINPQYSYGWTVPFLAGYSFWRRHKTAPTPSLHHKRIIPCLLIIVAALLLLPVRLVQEANPDWRLASWIMALSAGVITASGIYWSGGPKWLLHFAFPIAFFFVAVPWPTSVEQFLVQGLMRLDARIDVQMLRVIGIHAVQFGNVIQVDNGYVGIDEACTGIRSLQATFMVALFLGELYNFTVRRRIILVVAAAILAFGCNLIRTFLLVWLAVKNGLDSIKNWHDPAGYMILLCCLIGLWGLSLFLRGKESASTKMTPPTPAFPVSRLILGYLVAVIILAEAGTQAWYRASEKRRPRPESWTITWPSQTQNWMAVPVAESAQELLRYNQGGGGAWTGSDGHDWNLYFFRWLPGRTAGLFVKNHRPDVCLPASGMQQRGTVKNKVLTVNDVSLPIRSYVFDNHGRALHVFYCYWDGTPIDAATTNDENWTSLGRLQAAWRGKRDVGTQMLEIVAWDYDDDEKAEQAAIEQLSGIIRATDKHR